MQLTFLGTCAGAPSIQRNVTAIALSLGQNSEIWLFDCGEGTQRQFMRSELKPGRLSKIFITHLHGDHIFGLPGLLTSRSMSSITSPLTIYGPKGLKTFIETALQVSGSWVSFPLDIIEVNEGMIVDDGHFTVTAGLLNHVVPCFGYRIAAADIAGPLDTIKLKADNIPRGAWLQRLKQGKMVTLPDGRTFDGRDYTGPATKGKSVAIFGDTAPCDSARALAQDVDVLVHETTLQADMAAKANERGHSTTVQAAQLARQAGVKRLIATHFSSRYRQSDMPQLLAECQSVFPATELAKDFDVFEL